MSPSVSIRLLLTQSDARLLALASDGHERAFEALVQRYRRPLLAYCRRLLLPDERSEDALQQGLMQAWLALQHGCAVSDVRSWLYRIVHNAALNMLRVSGYDYGTLSESLSGAEAPHADLERRIAVREALAGLAALPEMQREALLRTAVEGSSHVQVAQDLGVSENALRGLVYRARASLRSATTAIMPPPLIGWALSSSVRSVPLAEPLAGAGAGGGSAGLASLLLKGGAVVLTAGTLATGIVAVRHDRHRATGKLRDRESSLPVASIPASGSGARPTEEQRARPAKHDRALGGAARRAPAGRRAPLGNVMRADNKSSAPTDSAGGPLSYAMPVRQASPAQSDAEDRARRRDRIENAPSGESTTSTSSEDRGHEDRPQENPPVEERQQEPPPSEGLRQEDPSASDGSGAGPESLDKEAQEPDPSADNPEEKSGGST